MFAFALYMIISIFIACLQGKADVEEEKSKPEVASLRYIITLKRLYFIL